MAKDKQPPRWYEVTGVNTEDGTPQSSVTQFCELPDQPTFTGKLDARKWLLGTPDEPGNAPCTGKFLLLRQLDEQDLVVETVRTVRKAPDVPPENEEVRAVSVEEAEQKSVWETDDGTPY